MAQQSLEFVQFVIAITNASALALKDGKVGVGDLIYFFQALQQAPAAFENVEQIPAELANLSEAQKSALNKEIEKLDLANDQIEAFAEKALKASVLLAELVFSAVKKA